MTALDRSEVIAALVACAREPDAIVATTGYTGRALWANGDRSGNFYVVGSMGCASSVALGVSLNAPGVVVYCLDGDGAALMRLEAMVSIGRYRPPHLVHMILDNGAHESTGAQATLSGGVDFVALAHAVGYSGAVRCDSLVHVRESLLSAQASTGAHLLHVPTKLGKNGSLPRPPDTLFERSRRFSEHLRSSQR